MIIKTTNVCLGDKLKIVFNVGAMLLLQDDNCCLNKAPKKGDVSCNKLDRVWPRGRLAPVIEAQVEHGLGVKCEAPPLGPESIKPALLHSIGSVCSRSISNISITVFELIMVKSLQICN